MNEKRIEYFCLANRVLAVAVGGYVIKDWSAYIDAVPGIDHENEYDKVLSDGIKLPYEIAKILFPEFDKKFKWREGETKMENEYGQTTFELWKEKRKKCLATPCLGNDSFSCKTCPWLPF